MQHIGVIKEDGEGKMLSDSGINFADILKLHSPTKETPLLNGIDPYDSTIFNSLQVKDLISELEYQKAEINDTAVVGLIEKVISFISDVEVHEHIRFLGD